MSAVVNHERCVGCELCTRACGVTRAITLNLVDNWVEVSEELCWECGACEKMCPFSAIMLAPWAEPNKALRDEIYAKHKNKGKARTGARAETEPWGCHISY